MTWRSSLGAWPAGDGTRFRVWAPEVQRLELIIEGAGGAEAHALEKAADGTFSGAILAVRPGDRYRYRVDGNGPFPDPCSRFQPEGVHGPSEVIDPRSYNWTDTGWRNLPLEDLVVYELHVGAFTPAGTFAGVVEKLPYLKELGVNCIELMPVGDFPGQRNWGYDGVSIFAPARCYGQPDDLRRLVDAAHGAGLAVLLDVVYNHLGPDGNYTSVYSPYYFSGKHHTPWGNAVNFDDKHNRMVRDFFIENALHWLHEYHFDGLRLDATHAIIDDGPRHFLAELQARVRESLPGRPVHIIAEDHRNLASMMQPEARGGWGMDGVWADDFHHQMRVLLAGDREGYYRDFSGTAEDVATTIRQGWFFRGQYSEHLEEHRGTDADDLPPRGFVICLQNHDQIGNRAFGGRLGHEIEPAPFRAATALLLCCPQTPLLFMGQEWTASSPFLFFTDHNPELGRLVTEGRRKEFRHFSAFTDPAARERIPDPQAPQTFEASKLRWDERGRGPHAGTFRLYQALLKLRRDEPALRAAGRDSYDVAAADGATVLLLRRGADGSLLLLVCRLKGAGRTDLSGQPMLNDLSGRKWEVALSTEEPRFESDLSPPRVGLPPAAWAVEFARPGAVLLKG